MKALKALWKNLEEVVILLIFFGMIMTVFLQVINREFIHARLNFTEELARFMYVYIAFIGFACATKIETHLRIEVVYNMLSEKMRAIHDMITSFLAIGTGVWLFQLFLQWMDFQSRAKAPSLRWPMNYIYIIGPISMVLLIVRSAERIVRDCQKLKKLNSEKGGRV